MMQLVTCGWRQLGAAGSYEVRWTTLNHAGPCRCDVGDVTDMTARKEAG